MPDFIIEDHSPQDPAAQAVEAIITRVASLGGDSGVYLARDQHGRQWQVRVDSDQAADDTVTTAQGLGLMRAAIKALAAGKPVPAMTLAAVLHLADILIDLHGGPQAAGQARPDPNSLLIDDPAGPAI